VGSVLGDIERGPGAKDGAQTLRVRLSEYIHEQVDGSAGGIAAALVAGDRGAISEADEEAMRRSGLAHLLSISGLHVTAVVGFAMFLAMRSLALSRRLALGGYVLPLAAAVAALAGGGYTLLAGAEVPTLRSFIAALLVLVAFLMGREAMTLRLVAAGALIVLLWRPESLAGPSFQLSFAAITAIVALHEGKAMQRFLARREEPWVLRFGRGVAGLVITGLAVEVALAPIALFHFHKAGLYGALANVIAIPLTTFVIMPMEALALLFDSVGLGAPFWWVAEQALNGLIWLAHSVADAPGAVALALGGGGSAGPRDGRLAGSAAARPSDHRRRQAYRRRASRWQLCADARPGGGLCARFDGRGGGDRHAARGADRARSCELQSRFLPLGPGRPDHPRGARARPDRGRRDGRSVRRRRCRDQRAVVAARMCRALADDRSRHAAANRRARTLSR
jgi:ComEC/Rec2-related protein